MRIGARLGLGFASVVLIMLVVVIVSYRSVVALNESTAWNEHTYEVINEAD